MLTTFAQVPQGFTVHSAATAMTFPAGEAHIKTDAAEGQTPLYLYLTGADANEYMSAAMWIDYAHQGGHEVKALIPYLPGARQDRGNPFGAKVYANLINAMNADEVVCFDPHSPVMPGLVNNLRVVGSESVIARAVRKHLPGYAGVICPDEGAKARSAVTAQALGLPLFHAAKHRDFATGKLSGFTCEELPAEGRFLVVDDICDGGGTFMGLAQATGLGPGRLDLWVSHGVFSGNAGQLTEAFGNIFTTDSHPGAANPAVGARITPLISHLI
ncbi:ribose-phosphate pyrophosphokinase [Arthrobacter caoxuetaonis]|uniref:Ribose-phosphate pyrophosphokinase n=1 Tax=Arthrobacter caoxuetaonis TaxID=2886935 RepID=A0A9X1MI94_9MICC|nr:ribose-phosphate pyrophosphokinase [Arthrobacter caoxuetaonis]MCC3299685.1 ribose-phosphate pyrophosphokinase [Arthrobacter caoxuetaonis]USQ58974.1 ribose-phosphate pyrophosphokinase [Arthrobacter caoxuetaonis]